MSTKNVIVWAFGLFFALLGSFLLFWALFALWATSSTLIMI